MTKTTESGYEITIRAFVPADPRKPGTMEDAMRLIGALGNTNAILEGAQRLTLEHFDVEWTMLPARWIARRKVPASRAGSHGESPTPEAPEAGQAPQPAVSGADLDLTVPEGLRRLPR